MPSLRRFDGKLQSWNDERGFGFIAPSQGGQEIFVHIKSFPHGTGRPVIGWPLSFEVEWGPQGKKRAKSVQFVCAAAGKPRRRAESPAPWTPLRIVVIPLFVLAFGVIAATGLVKPVVALAYGVASLVTFLVYALDKSAATRGQWRTSESTLHGLSLACGWPGALLAQQMLRHKTSKESFLTVYWATVLLNIGAFVVGLSFLAVGLSLLLLVIGLWNATLLLSEKGYYAMSFVLALFSAVTVQKNTRDNTDASTNAPPRFSNTTPGDDP